jgi:hypothetical protein
LRLRYACWIVLLCLGTAKAFAFVNGGFETGDLSGWTVLSGTGVAQAVVAVPPGPAPNTNGNLNRVDQGNFAAELYSGTGGSATSFIRISQDELVTASNTIFQFRYAAVLDGTHSVVPTDDASVTVAIMQGASTVYSATYQYANSPAPLVDDGVPLHRHLPWTTINIDMSAYIGSVLTVSFEARDCLYGGHYTLAYVDSFNFVPPTPTVTPTRTPTPTVTPTFTISPTFTASPSFSHSPTQSPSFTASPTFTVTETFTRSYTPTITQTFTQTPTVTPTPTITQTSTITPTFTPTTPPLTLVLHPPNPNPSDNGVWLPYSLGTDSDVDVQVWTVAGEPIRAWNEGFRLKGVREAFWDHRNEAGVKVGSGIFLYRVQARSPAGETRDAFGKCAVLR